MARDTHQCGGAQRMERTCARAPEHWASERMSGRRLSPGETKTSTTTTTTTTTTPTPPTPAASTIPRKNSRMKSTIEASARKVEIGEPDDVGRAPAHPHDPRGRHQHAAAGPHRSPCGTSELSSESLVTSMRTRTRSHTATVRNLLLAACALLASAASATAAAAAAASGELAPEQPFVFGHEPGEREPSHWLAQGRAALEGALRWSPNLERAKSAVIFIGDGMSLTTITAARILHGQLANRSGEEDQLSFEQLNNVALIKTYNIDQQVPDSAATATAILTGVKANFYTLGVNGNVRLNETNCSRVQANEVSSLLKWAQDAGKSTGIVTNTRITHATPAAAYAHVSNRRWECDTLMPRSLDGAACKDIARQLIEDEPGNKLNVVLGGGRRCFFGPDYFDPGPTGQAGMRLDQRNLISQWIARRHANDERNYAFVNSTKDLRSINTDTTDYLLGLFSYSHMSYEELRDTSPQGEPSLVEMTEVALRVLGKNPRGFVLLVEGGRIDHAHHENIAGVALRETIALHWAVARARQLVDARDTLLGVTADHAHALTINGIAPRGNPILGLSRYKESSSQLPYTTLLYGNGPGNQRGAPRADPRLGPNSTESPYHVQYAAIHQEEAFHDGSDVAIFAAGPHAHLFQGTQEQSYIAHVFAYALCVGQYQLAGPHCQPGAAGQRLRPPPPLGSGDQATLDATLARQHSSHQLDQVAPDASVRAHSFLAAAAAAAAGSSSSSPAAQSAGSPNLSALGRSFGAPGASNMRALGPGARLNEQRLDGAGAQWAAPALASGAGASLSAPSAHWPALAVPLLAVSWLALVCLVRAPEPARPPLMRNRARPPSQAIK